MIKPPLMITSGIQDLVQGQMRRHQEQMRDIVGRISLASLVSSRDLSAIMRPVLPPPATWSLAAWAIHGDDEERDINA